MLLMGLSLAALLLVLAAVRLAWHSPLGTTPRPNPQRVRTRQLTTWDGLDIFPALSPDGNAIAYSSDHDGSFELYVKQLTPGGREIQLTSDRKGNFQPAWSPDGKTIAFYKRDSGGIWVMPSLGGTAKQLLEFGSHPVWSPDGMTLAFQSDPLNDINGTANLAMPPSTIWKVSARGGSPEKLTNAGTPPGGHSSPSWSPDGKRIVFVTNSFSGSQLWYVSADGVERKLVLDSDVFDPIFAPDGGAIYYTGSLDSGWVLWKLPISEKTGEPVGDPVVVKDTGSILYRHLSISSNGKRMVCSALSMQSNLRSISVSPESGAAVGEPFAVTEDTSFRKSTPRFSPDGLSIAFPVSRAGVRRFISVTDPNGNNGKELTVDLPLFNVPGWLPGGNRIVFLTSRKGVHMLASVDVETGKAQDIAELPADAGFPSLSPDGLQVAYHIEKAGAINTWVYNTADGQSRQITFGNSLMGFPCWSQDGKYVAVESKHGDNTDIEIVPGSGGTPIRLTAGQGQSWSYSWSPDGDKIAFAGLRKGVWNVWWVSRSGQLQKQVTAYSKPNQYVRYPAWSPLGDRIVYELGETTGNVWALDVDDQ
jgi:Tol biopolymer transport system component